MAWSYNTTDIGLIVMNPTQTESDPSPIVYPGHVFMFLPWYCLIFIKCNLKAMSLVICFEGMKDIEVSK